MILSEWRCNYEWGFAEKFLIIDGEIDKKSYFYVEDNPCIGLYGELEIYENLLQFFIKEYKFSFCESSRERLDENKLLIDKFIEELPRLIKLKDFL